MQIDKVRSVQANNFDACQVAHARLLKESPINSELDVFDARRNVMAMVTELGFSREQGHYLVTVITELGHNIVFHAEHGRIRIEQVYTLPSIIDVVKKPAMGIRIVAQDKGPGIPDVQLALQEGYSTRNSLGCGLSGVVRLMDELHIDSGSNGTRVTTVLWYGEH